MAKRRWQDLSTGQRRVILTVGVVEGALKLAMLADLKRRPQTQIRGAKRWWALSLVLNTGGLLPLAYFVFGRSAQAKGWD